MTTGPIMGGLLLLCFRVRWFRRDGQRDDHNSHRTRKPFARADYDPGLATTRTREANQRDSVG